MPPKKLYLLLISLVLCQCAIAQQEILELKGGTIIDVTDFGNSERDIPNATVVPNATGPMTFWEKVKYVFASGSQLLETNMINFITGFLSGAFTLFLLSFLFKKNRERKSKYEREYQSNFFTTKIRDTIRRIIFEYSIKRINNDFLLNIKFKGETRVQIMHRAHFPELCASEGDVEFGLAVYIPTEWLTHEQVFKLESILIAESEKFDKSRRPVPYYVLDLGRRVRYGGLLVSRIVKELFNPDDSDISLELFSEGTLPYFYPANKI